MIVLRLLVAIDRPCRLQLHIDIAPIGPLSVFLNYRSQCKAFWFRLHVSIQFALPNLALFSAAHHKGSSFASRLSGAVKSKFRS